MNAYPQSIDRRGQEVWTKVEMSSGERRASLAGDNSDSRSSNGGSESAGSEEVIDCPRINFKQYGDG